MSQTRTVLLASALLLAGSSIAQYNQKGRVHLSLGASVGGHGTELESRYTVFGFTRTDSDVDGAVTTSVPIQVDAALANRFTLGILLEPGRYVPDSADADQTNGFFNFAIQPKFYLINGNRVAWTASLQVGAAALRIQDDTPGEKVDARYSGGAFGLGSGVAFGLGDHVGIGFDVRYLATNLKLRAMELNDVSVTDVYDATLRTAGFVAQLSLAFRFGGK